MTWDRYKPFSYDDFASHIRSLASQTNTDWWIYKKIRVFCDSKIPRQAIKTIVDSVDYRAREVLGLKFNLVMPENNRCHERGIEQMAQATVDGQIDAQRLFELAALGKLRKRSEGGRQHAGIYITTGQFSDSPDSWGAASFESGTMIFALSEDRHRDIDFLRKVALHEAGHLIGMPTHCKIYKNVQGYHYRGLCNMDPGCSTDFLCQRCEGFIVHFFKQIVHDYEQRHRTQCQLRHAA